MHRHLRIYQTYPYFNPRPREGGDRDRPAPGEAAVYFNPRPPQGGRPSWERQYRAITAISIHAPRKGGDYTVGAAGLRIS